MPDQFKTNIATALREALVHAIPDTPSGSHRTLVVGQIIVNVHAPMAPPPEFEGPNKRRSTR